MNVETVLAWHAAVNAGDVDRVVALCALDVEVGGPRGVGRGTQVLREWVGRAGIRLVVRRVFAGDGVVVVEQAAAWGAAGASQVVASLFGVREGKIVRVVRFEDLPAALAAGGLDESAVVADG
jgi:ketosteroid isomerase-like protein